MGLVGNISRVLAYKNKSFFGRIFIVFTVVCMINSIFAGVLLYFALGDSITTTIREQLREQNINMQTMVSGWIAGDRNHENKKIVDSILSSSNFLSGAEAWIVNEHYEIEYFSKLPNEMNADIEERDGRYFLKKKKQLDKVLKSGNKGLTKVGDFYELFSNKDTPYLVEALPMKVRTFEGDKTYATYLFIEQPGAFASQRTAIKMYLISSVTCSLLAILLIFIWTRKMTNPLIEMSRAANKIAEGQFGRRVDERYPFELGELAHNFNIMAENIEKNDEIRKEFIGNVSHELRTPMTSMRGFIDAILDGTIPPEKQDHYLTIVRDEIIRLDNLTNELLDFSRMEAGALDLTYERFDIAEMVKNVLLKLESLADDKLIYVDVNLKQPEIYVNADKEKIERVFINIISNAIKFLEDEGHLIIEIDQREDTVLVKIEDDGPGIEKADLEHVFDRFYKVDKSRSINKQGTGLGLCIVKQIIDAHGHKVWAESVVGEGTAFFFTLSS